MDKVNILLYAINSTGWFIKRLDEEINQSMDVSGIIQERGQSIRISAMHPFCEIFSFVFKNDNATPDYQGIFPVISVSRGNSTSGAVKFIGDDRKSHSNLFTKKMLSELSEDNDFMYAVYGKNDISKIKNWLNEMPNGLVFDVKQKKLKETIHFSIWATNFEEYQRIALIVKAAMENLRTELMMDKINVNPDDYTEDGDLVNFDFSVPLWGTEAKIEIENRYTTISIYKQTATAIKGIELELEAKGNKTDNGGLEEYVKLY